MPIPITLKKSSVAAKVPLATDLTYGELALNYSDGKLYYKKADNSLSFFSDSASGATSAIDGYAENIPSGTVPSATGTSSIALGAFARAAGASSFAVLTNSNTLYGAAGDNSIAMGNFCSALDQSSISIGSVSTASAANSVALGYNALSEVNGKFAYSGTNSFGVGGAQTGCYVLTATTQNTSTTARLKTDAGASSSVKNQIALQNNSAIAFTGIIVARRQSSLGVESAAWAVKGLIRKENTAGLTALVNSAIEVISYPSSAWSVSLSADTTLGCLAINVASPPIANTNVRWVATIQTSEVVYA